MSISLQTASCRKSASQWNVDVLHDEVKSSGDLTLRHSASQPATQTEECSIIILETNNMTIYVCTGVFDFGMVTPLK